MVGLLHSMLDTLFYELHRRHVTDLITVGYSSDVYRYKIVKVASANSLPNAPIMAWNSPLKRKK